MVNFENQQSHRELVNHHHGYNILNRHKKAEQWNADQATAETQKALCKECEADYKDENK